MHLKINPLNIRGLFDNPALQFPNFYQRIDDNLILTGVNVILIDGKSQTGKSTLADHIVGRYDSEYQGIYTVGEYLDYLEHLKDLWFQKRFSECMYRWVFWDEPQLEIPRSQFWTERNSIIQSITSSFGFLKPSLIMALPNIKGLSDMVMTNVLFRISVVARLDKNKQRYRVGYVKTPFFNEKRNKYCWRLVEEHLIPQLPDITKDENYMNNKVNNFFNVQLPRWKHSLGTSNH